MEISKQSAAMIETIMYKVVKSFSTILHWAFQNLDISTCKTPFVLFCFANHRKKPTPPLYIPPPQHKAGFEPTASCEEVPTETITLQKNGSESKQEPHGSDLRTCRESAAHTREVSKTTRAAPVLGPILITRLWAKATIFTFTFTRSEKI